MESPAQLKAPMVQTKSDDKSTTAGASSDKKARKVLYNVDCIDEDDECNNEESECEERCISEISETEVRGVSKKQAQSGSVSQASRHEKSGS